jgi:hypothetical protein
VSLEDVDPDDVIQILGEETTNDYGGSLCRVKLFINFDQQLLIIEFPKHIGDDVLEDQDVQIEVLVTVDEMFDTDIWNVLEYACSDDQCELDFVKKYIDWFMSTDYPELADQLTPLILGNSNEAGK